MHHLADSVYFLFIFIFASVAEMGDEENDPMHHEKEEKVIEIR